MGLNSNIDISVSLGKLTLKSPLVIVSGVFGYGEEFNHIQEFDVEQAGAAILKGVSLKPWEGNPPPRIVETTGGMLNSIGLQNIGVERLVHEKLPKWKDVNTHVVVNVAGHTVEEYVEVAKLAALSPYVAALELNLSCPNVAMGGMAFGMDPNLIEVITALVKEQVSHLPVWVKLTPNVEDISPLAIAAVKGGADAISLINTVRGMTIDIYKRCPQLANNVGGLSGPAIKPIALLKVAEVARTLRELEVNIPLIGIGGVTCGRDVLEFMIAGASAVGIGTALFYDPLCLRRINSELRALLEESYHYSGRSDDLRLTTWTNTLRWHQR